MGNKTKLFIVYIFILLIIILSACNQIKKAERTVLNNIESSERVFRELEKTHPCANDTTFETKYDTITEVEHYISKIPRYSFQGFAIPPQPDTLIKKVKIYETKTAYVVDNRRLNIMTDSVRFYKTSLQDSINTSKKWRSYFWWLLLIVVGFITIKKVLCNYLNILR